jgi:hypothetical protein
MNVIDLSGPAGNAFALMGTAQNLAKQLDMDAREIINEMRAGDYNHLLTTFEKHFGSIIEFIGDPRTSNDYDDDDEW